MGKIFILGHNKLITLSGVEYIEIPIFRNDYEIHKWLLSLFKDHDIDKLIIDITNNFKISILLGLHIRLSLTELKNKALIPILYVSFNPLDIIVKEVTIWGHIFATKGIYFSIFNQNSLKKEIEISKGITPDEYKLQFLEIIKIMPNERIGRHSIANIWGAYVMDKAAKTMALQTNESLNKIQSDIYFKYLIAANYDLSKLKKSSSRVINKNTNVSGANIIESSGKKILLIDDEADKGWKFVLRKIFKYADLHVIDENVTNYNNLTQQSKDIIENTSFDLYLVDLRLNGIREESISQTDDLSGMSVFKKIKSLNDGNQIIIFTASNKVWNQKALFEIGANGYYMKESPEYNFSDNFSLQNYNTFKDEVLNAFNLGFLRSIFTIHYECKSFINRDRAYRRSNYQKFYDRTLSQLEIAFTLLKQAKNAKYLNLAYISYYKILEDYASQYDNFNRSYNSYYVNGIKVIDGTNNRWKLKFKTQSSNNNRLSYFEIGSEYNNKQPTFLAKVSFLLAYKFSKNNNYLKKWGVLNDIRNTVVVHGGRDNNINIGDLLSLLDIIKLFLTNN